MTVDLTDKLMQQAKIRVRDGFIAIAIFLVLLLTLRIGHEASLQYFAAEQRDELLLADKVLQLDGEIMESVRMIIQTNDPAWHEAYTSRSRAIAQTANGLVDIATEPAKSNFLHAMPKALSVQTALHKKIFALVENGVAETANKLLAGQQYKQARSNVLGTFFTLEKEIETNLQQKQGTETFFANGLTLLLIVVGVGLIHRRQQYLLEEDKKQFSIIADDLRNLNDENAVLETISIDQQQQITELAAVAEKTSNVVILHDADQKVRWVNKAFSKLTGLTLSDIAGRSFPMDPIQKQNVEEVLAGAAPAVDHVDGEELACPDVSSRFDSVISSADSTPIWLDVDRQVFKDASGHITGYITVGTNVSLRRKHELKIASYATDMKQFAHIASHDLKEPLRQINDYLRILREADSADDDELKDRCMDVMDKAVTRGRNLVGDLLRFAKIQNRSLEKNLEPLDETLELIIEQMQVSKFRGDVSFEIDIPSVHINADAALLQSVIQNLMSNAVKYTSLERPNLVQMGFEDRGSHYCLFVSDTGIGFAADQNEAIFEPFKRLVGKKDFAGSGVGLSIVSSIIQKHGWTITAFGQEDVGARLEIHIPARDVSAINVDVINKKEAA